MEANQHTMLLARLHMAKSRVCIKNGQKNDI